MKYLVHLRDREGMPTEEIIRKHVFLTAGACGPCRFGTYVTEYRKALRDAGFDGFRVLLFQQQGGLKQATGEDAGLEFNAAVLHRRCSRRSIAGDVLNVIGYRIRPYEVEPGATDRALEDCKQIISDAFVRRGASARARCGNRAAGSRKVQVDRLQPKPKVSIIGEFWAMTTEGDGNYRLQRFLESEGAEVDIQLVTAWLLYNIWEHTCDTKQPHDAAGSTTAATFGLEGHESAEEARDARARREGAARLVRGRSRSAIGLDGYHLPDMDEIATISHQYYDNHLRGGEGHMEVGKLIQSRGAAEGRT